MIRDFPWTTSNKPHMIIAPPYLCCVQYWEEGEGQVGEGLCEVCACLPCSVEVDEPPLVKTAATLFRKYCYEYREQLSAGIICAGWDERHGGQVPPTPHHTTPHHHQNIGYMCLCIVVCMLCW